MSEPNWDLLLGPDTGAREERDALLTRLRTDHEARETFKNHVLVDAMLADVYATTRFNCLDIDMLGGLAAGTYRCSNEDLIHLAVCRACREELQQLETFHASLEVEPEAEPAWPQRLLGLGKSFVDQLAAPQTAPLYAAAGVGNATLPAITCGILSQPITFHVASGELQIEAAVPLQKPLQVKVTSEQGETMVTCEGAGPFSVKLDRVWEIHIGE
ncbi:hypothetical protein [Acanthopleuribacter pedis]|uniref:Uncharacterized protein n=1 Tax=Acanthopleuribacter pedis TaxID=442870 RepID=A0A8J7Q9U9_9BACT|nr:hypothetical protein [Acanthopleuribacter pedis]MBO1316991.1 hypothetical protein [Acanthopleuribacter pedis]